MTPKQLMSNTIAGAKMDAYNFNTHARNKVYSTLDAAQKTFAPYKKYAIGGIVGAGILGAAQSMYNFFNDDD